jgi:Domain of unknown function (DUF5664)
MPFSQDWKYAENPEPAPIPGDGGGLRFNEGKPRFDLLPPEALEALATHYGLAGGPPAGPPKYPERNWERGMAMCICFGSMMRHAWKWMRGHDFDDGPKGTGSHHMIAVAWNAIAIFTYHTRGIGTDDRPCKAISA